MLELAERLAEVDFKRTDRVPAEQSLRCVVKQFPERLARRQILLDLADFQDEQAVLSDREGLAPSRRPAPSADARQIVGEVLVGPAI